MIRKLKKRIILACDPNAYNAGAILRRFEQHEEQMASAPGGAVKDNVPLVIGGLIATLVMSGLFSSLVPGTIATVGAALFFLATCLVFWKKFC